MTRKTLSLSWKASSSGRSKTLAHHLTMTEPHRACQTGPWGPDHSKQDLRQREEGTDPWLPLLPFLLPLTRHTAGIQLMWEPQKQLQGLLLCRAGQKPQRNGSGGGTQVGAYVNCPGECGKCPHPIMRDLWLELTVGYTFRNSQSQSEGMGSSVHLLYSEAMIKHSMRL